MGGDSQQDAATGQRIRYRRLRAPTSDGDVLIDPPLASHSKLVAQNLANFSAWNLSMGGRTVKAIRAEARQHLIAAATHFTSQYADIPNTSDVTDRPVFLVGHQPELFHPGVWLKNFILDSLAKSDGATAIHVLIDNDVVHDATIRVPTGGINSPHLESVELDQPCDPVPWEDRTILDANLLRTAGQRIADKIRWTVSNPIAEVLWKNLGNNELQLPLGQLLARMRHRLEHSWGLQTLEVPLSQLCHSQPYRWFLSALISALPVLHASFNSALAEYRRVHKLRSPSHPMPDLNRVGDRFETPFWIWTEQQPQRRPLFAIPVGKHWRLDDAGGWTFELLIENDDYSSSMKQLAELEDSGVRIRPRALTTTMFLRLFLSDFFIHGIGGAKYDQVTDCVIHDVFGIQPPAFLTATGTRLLPTDSPTKPRFSVQEIDQLLRNWDHHPEKVLPLTLSAENKARKDELVHEKQCLTSRDCKLGGKQRHLALMELNEALRRLAPGRGEELLQMRAQAESQHQASELLGSREFSFCLFPESALRDWLLGASTRTT